jgi:hypothetical protein
MFVVKSLTQVTPGTSQGTQSFLRALERSRYKLLQICTGSKSKSKKCDKQMNFIVRVMASCYY